MRHRHSIDRNSGQRRGGALVEFAVVAPFFVTLVVGGLEVGRAVTVSNKLTSGLREGGRLATMKWDQIIGQGTNINDKVINDIRAFYSADRLPGDNIFDFDHLGGAE